MFSSHLLKLIMILLVLKNPRARVRDHSLDIQVSVLKLQRFLFQFMFQCQRIWVFLYFPALIKMVKWCCFIYTVHGGPTYFLNITFLFYKYKYMCVYIYICKTCMYITTYIFEEIWLYVNYVTIQLPKSSQIKSGTSMQVVLEIRRTALTFINIKRIYLIQFTDSILRI